ncbi:hypothetical protein HOLleu_32459 [Holothuria leucospilota]|uniref:Uncharacterized protein n=1 Tax=Holothuria leucospilota TaxID=206669 RepID=A0A9Q1BIQ5_HOLLE|nr:hypothetical protein HOLleu_32459 [Holothuria leucospilota]
MMDSKRERLVVLFTFMAFCELTAAMGLCKFGRAFPSQGKLNGTTFDNVAKVIDHLTSLTSTKNQEDFSTSTKQSLKMQNATMKDESTIKSGTVYKLSPDLLIP